MRSERPRAEATSVPQPELGEEGRKDEEREGERETQNPRGKVVVQGATEECPVNFPKVQSGSG